MAKLNIKIEQIKGESNATIKIKFTNDVPKDEILSAMREMFEIEMYSAEITESKMNTTISIKTDNEEKISLVKTGMLRIFRERSGLNNINAN